MRKRKKNEHPVLFSEMDEAEDHELSVESLLSSQRPDAFDFKLELKLKAGNQIHSVPVAAGHCFGDRIEEIIEKQFNAVYFKKRLRAIVGEPMPHASDSSNGLAKMLSEDGSRGSIRSLDYDDEI